MKGIQNEIGKHERTKYYEKERQIFKVKELEIK